MDKKKIGIISQARMTSTRLPGKVMLKIGDKYIIDYHVARLRKSGLQIYIATTKNATDDVIVEWAIKNNIRFYRGDENNVLSRYYECAKINKLDVIIRVTSDCPLIDGNLLREGIEKYLQLDNENIYLSNCVRRTYPRGFDFEIFSFKLLDDAYHHAVNTSDLEHVTPYIRNNALGSVVIENFENSLDKSRFRITLDTKEDFELIYRLINDFSADNKNSQEIINIMEKFTELPKINCNIHQKEI